MLSTLQLLLYPLVVVWIVESSANVAQLAAAKLCSIAERVTLAFGITEPEPDRGISGAISDFVANIWSHATGVRERGTPDQRGILWVGTAIGSSVKRVATVFGLVKPDPEPPCSAVVEVVAEVILLVFLIVAGFVVFKIFKYYNNNADQLRYNNRWNHGFHIRPSPIDFMPAVPRVIRRQNIRRQTPQPLPTFALRQWPFMQNAADRRRLGTTALICLMRNQRALPGDSALDPNTRRPQSEPPKGRIFNDECPICCDPLERLVLTLSCDHGLHVPCYDQLVASDFGPNCPLCRHPIQV